MLPLLEKGTRILNIDESWLNETNFTRKMWCPPQSPATVQTRPISYRIALIAALDTEGCIYYSLTQANTDQNVMMVFLEYLVEQLDLTRPSWRDDTVLLLDGARYHTGSAVREYLRKLELDVIWSGPYSYSTAPIEMVFGALKFSELNPDRKPTGKRVSASSFLPDPVVSRSGRGHGRCQAHTDAEEHVHHVLASHDHEPLQVLVLPAGLSTVNGSVSSPLLISVLLIVVLTLARY